MKSRHRLLPALLGAAVLSFVSASSSDAAIVLTIDEFTTTTFKISISGTLDVAADFPELGPTDEPSLFGVVLNKNASIPFYTGTPVKSTGDITMGASSLPTFEAMFNAADNRYGLFFSYDSTFPVSAGTSFAGSVTFTGNFDPTGIDSDDFQLWSGYNFSLPANGFGVFHVNAVPEPSAAARAGIAALGLLRRRR